MLANVYTRKKKRESFVSEKKVLQTLKPTFVQAAFDNLTIHDSIFYFSHFPDDDPIRTEAKKKIYIES
jgi:hypothetical protein